MVKIRHDLPRRADGRPDTDAWLAGLADGDGVNAPMVAAIDLVHDDRSLEYGLEVAQLLIELGLDTELLVTGVLCEVTGSGLLDPAIVRDRVGSAIAGQLEALLRVSSTHVYRLSSSPMVRSQSEDQVDNIRHLLVALIDDPRVAVVKLAERVIALRMAKSAPPAVQRRVANEALRIFAPLAGRLGIWQLKWTLEDLAFRYLYPRDYKEIATALDSRREEREREVEAIVADIERRLARAGIEADVVGRAKHIYSIWRKMGRKSIDFGQVYDVQAVRVVVRSVPQCYGVLGVVHTAWHHIPSEFDDYIANPKDNGYRSIHTAVLVPGGKVLEVQIRTVEMDDESELGVCAHWTYKGEEGEALRSRKMQWLRQVLQWHDDIDVYGSNGQLADSEAVDGAGERVYVATPQGDVLDLTRGATPVDFAYRVHTEIGHRCVGARVDGQDVLLNTRLFTGQSVEIVTGLKENPRREWLNPALGFVKTGRARAKIQSWFRAQLAESNVAAGRALLFDTLDRLGLTADRGELAQQMGYETEAELLQAVGVGECQVIDLVRVMGQRRREAEEQAVLSATGGESLPSIQEIRIVGDDRQGLLRDVTAVLAALDIDVVSTRARAQSGGDTATMALEVQVDDVLQFARALDRLRRVPSVREVRRR